MSLKSNRPDAARVHDRSRAMYRERAKDRYFHEKKDMEHEFHTNEVEIKKAINDNYNYLRTKQSHNNYLVTFKNPDDNRMKRFKFEFGENYEKLKHLWEDQHH